MKTTLISIVAAALVLSGGAVAKSARGAGEEIEISRAGFDGVWELESTVASGNCPALTPASVQIEAGRVVAVNGGAAQPWGYVMSNGEFAIRLTFADGQITRASGHLRRADGSGAWSSSTALCGGVWRARRASAQ